MIFFTTFERKLDSRLNFLTLLILLLHFEISYCTPRSIIALYGKIWDLYTLNWPIRLQIFFALAINNVISTLLMWRSKMLHGWWNDVMCWLGNNDMKYSKQVPEMKKRLLLPLHQGQSLLCACTKNELVEFHFWCSDWSLKNLTSLTQKSFWL